MADVKAKKVTATGALGVGPARIKGWTLLVPGTAGSIVVRDGSATGDVVLSVDLDSTSDASFNVPGDGVRCAADPHITLTTVTSVTVFYG